MPPSGLESRLSLSGLAQWPPRRPVPPPTNTVAPVVTGSSVVGQVLSCSTGTWTGSPVTYRYQWYASGSSSGPWAGLVGRTASTYTVQVGYVGQYLMCEVTAVNAYGQHTVESNAVGPVTA